MTLEKPKLNSAQSEIIKYVKAWVKYASEFGVSAALKTIDRRKNETLDEKVIRDIFCEYFGSTEEYSITDPSSFPELRIEAIEFNDKSGFSVHYDLAINETATDLTAIFEFKKADDQYLVFLDDIHVL